MSQDDLDNYELFLRRRIAIHDLIQIGCITLLVPASIWAWWFSYGVAHNCAAYLFHGLCGFEVEPISALVGWAFILLLVVEGVRRGLEQWKSDSLDLSDIGDAANEYGASRSAAGARFQAEYIVYLLLLAPICLLKAVQCYRSIVWPAAETVAQASAALAHLSEQRRWIPVSQLGNSSRALRLLNRLGLIWIDIEAGEWSARIPPGKVAFD